MKRRDVLWVIAEHLPLTWWRACVWVSNHWWSGVIWCRCWRLLLLSLYSVLHHLSTFTFLLALLHFSSTDKWSLTWFQRAGSILMDHVSEKSFLCVFTLLWRYALITTSWSFIPHEHRHCSCPCCSLDLRYSKLEVLERRVVSHSSPKKDKGCLMGMVANLWHSGQNWHELLL